MAVFGATFEAGTTSGNLNNCRAMGGTFPVVSGAVLQSISYFSPDPASADLRFAVYQGGALDDPTGATLIEDLGVQACAAGAWATINSSTNPALTSGAIIWIVSKSNDGVPGWLYSSDSGDAGDFQSARGRFAATGFSTDETVGYPASFPTGGTFLNFWYSWYLTYSVASGLSIPTMQNRSARSPLLRM